MIVRSLCAAPLAGAQPETIAEPRTRAGREGYQGTPVAGGRASSLSKRVQQGTAAASDWASRR